MTANKRVLLIGAAAALLAAGAAQAQTVRGSLEAGSEAKSNFRRDRNVSVLQRPHPGYEAVGLRQGGFMIWPKLSTSFEHNDNIYATNTDEVSDSVWRIAPELSASSNWSRHSLQAYARGVLNRFVENTDQDTEDYAVGARGQLDVLRTAQVGAGADASRLTEPRTNPGSEGQRFPVEYRQTSAYLSGAREFNRLRVSSRLDWKELNYLNRAGNRAQDDRDRTQWLGTVRGEYAVSPDTSVFVQVAGNKRDYRLDRTPIVGGAPTYPSFVDRDSEGLEALVGANFELAALVRGEVGVGYMKQNFDDDGLDDVDGLGARAQLEWFPTQLLTLTMTGSRTIEDAAVPGSSSYLSNFLGLQADYEFRRNVLVSANLSYGEDDYRGIERKDDRLTAGVSATYILNRAVGLTAAYTHVEQDSKGADSRLDVSNYTMDRVGLTLTLQY